MLYVVGLGKLHWGFGAALGPLQEAVAAAAGAESATAGLSARGSHGATEHGVNDYLRRSEVQCDVKCSQQKQQLASTLYLQCQNTGLVLS